MTYGSICILFPPFAPRALSSPDLLRRLQWWGPSFAGLVFTETT